MTSYVIGIIKSFVLEGAIVFAVLAFLPVMRREFRLPMKIFGGVLAIVGCAAFFNFNPSHMPLGSHVHHWDSFHYFMGAKYFDELGYLHLYEATVAAAVEQGELLEIENVLDLGNYEIVSVSSLDLPAVRERFSPERWTEYKHDVRFFLGRIDRWKDLLLDHGYNSPPTRTVITLPLFQVASLSEGYLWFLAQLDFFLIAATLIFLLVTFDIRVALLAVVFFFCNQLAKFDFQAGSLLRYDWICALLAGLACYKRGWPKSAGVLFGYSVVSRIFPAAFVFFLVVKAVYERLRKTPDAMLEKCLKAFAVFLLVGGVITVAVYPEPGTWAQYADRMTLHGSHPSTNRVGLAVIDYYRGELNFGQLGPGPYPFEHFKRAVHERRTPMPFIVGLFALALMLYSTLYRKPMEVMQYGAVMIFCFAAASNYYYSFLVVFFLAPFAYGRAHLFDVLKIIGLMAVMIYGFTLEHLNNFLLVQCHHVSVGLLLVLAAGLVMDVLRIRRPGLEALEWPIPPTNPAGEP